jgi:hypothetical protein
MRTRLLLTCAVAALAVAGLPAARAAEPSSAAPAGRPGEGEDLAKLVSRSVWGVVPDPPRYKKDLRPGLIRGSAVAVSDAMLLAGCRLVDGRGRVGLVRHNKYWIGRVVAADAGRRVCVLAAPGAPPGVPGGFRTFGDLRVGEPVFGAASRTSVEVAVARGRLTAKRAGAEPRFETSLTLPGDARSVAVFDGLGNLIGLAPADGGAVVAGAARMVAAPISAPLAPGLAQRDLGPAGVRLAERDQGRREPQRDRDPGRDDGAAEPALLVVELEPDPVDEEREPPREARGWADGPGPDAGPVAGTDRDNVRGDATRAGAGGGVVVEEGGLSGGPAGAASGRAGNAAGAEGGTPTGAVEAAPAVADAPEPAAWPPEGFALEAGAPETATSPTARASSAGVPAADGADAPGDVDPSTSTSTDDADEGDSVDARDAALGDAGPGVGDATDARAGGVAGETVGDETPAAAGDVGDGRSGPGSVGDGVADDGAGSVGGVGSVDGGDIAGPGAGRGVDDETAETGRDDARGPGSDGRSGGPGTATDAGDGPDAAGGIDTGGRDEGTGAGDVGAGSDGGAGAGDPGAAADGGRGGPDAGGVDDGGVGGSGGDAADDGGGGRGSGSGRDGGGRGGGSGNGDRGGRSGGGGDRGGGGSGGGGGRGG